MKKILSLIFALSMLMSFSTVKAEGNVQEANALTMPGWTISTNQAATVERVYDAATDNHYAKLTNLGTGATFNKLYYQIPTSEFDPAHSYTISAKVRTANYTNSNNWLALSWGGKDNTPWIQQNGMQKGWITVAYTKDGGFTGKLGFGFTHAHACDLYIDDLMVYDNTTGSYLELENADFETTMECTSVNDASYIDSTLTWTVPDNMVGDAINVYKRELNGEKTLLTETPVAVENGMLNLPIQSESSYYLDIYTCYSGTEDVNTLVSIPMLGKKDFGEYRLFSGENEIDAVEAGTLTVKVPFINREIETGFGFEVIVLVKEGITTVNVENKPFTAEITEDFVDYSVDIAVEEVTENTNIEVYVWDGIENMNVLRDVSSF